MPKPFTIIETPLICKPCIFTLIEEERSIKGYSMLSDQSKTLLYDSLKVVFNQVQTAFNQTNLIPDTCVHFHIILSEILKSICMYSRSYNSILIAEIKNIQKHFCFRHQTISLYKLIENTFKDIYLSLISKNNNEYPSEVYFILDELLNQNAHTANFFYKKANFRCVEMVVGTLKGGY